MTTPQTVEDLEAKIAELETQRIDAIKAKRLAEVERTRQLAGQGVVDAQYELGFMYETGMPLKQNFTEAIRWYRLAAAQGDARAQANLGLMYAWGNGVEPDGVRAHMWLSLSVEQDCDFLWLKRTLKRVEEFLTRQEIAEARQMAQQCRARNFKHCE